LIQLLLATQAAVSAVYYLTAPFHLSVLVIFFWLTNTASILLLLKNHAGLIGEFSPNIKRYRFVFTVTLIISEVLINIASDSYQADNLHGLISDTEVLFTGMTLGVLWHYEIANKFKKLF
jgi:hypothetical protein